MGGDRRPTAAEDGMAVFSVTINVDKRRSPPHFDFRGQESATIYVRVARRDRPRSTHAPSPPRPADRHLYRVTPAPRARPRAHRARWGDPRLPDSGWPAQAYIRAADREA